MALSLFDPLWPMRPRYSPRLYQQDPWSLLDSFFNDSTQQMMLRDHAAQLSFGQNGEFNYRVDVSGFRPEEMNVNVEGDDIIVQGQHKSGNEDEQVQRSFYRRVRIPQGIHRESIQCNLDERGRLYVTGKKLQKDQEQSRSIPIGFKKSEALTDMSSDKQAEQNGANRQ